MHEHLQERLLITQERMGPVPGEDGGTVPGCAIRDRRATTTEVSLALVLYSTLAVRNCDAHTVHESETARSV